MSDQPESSDKPVEPEEIPAPIASSDDAPKVEEPTEQPDEDEKDDSNVTIVGNGSASDDKAARSGWWSKLAGS